MFLFEIYDTIGHPALGTEPEEKRISPALKARATAQKNEDCVRSSVLNGYPSDNPRGTAKVSPGRGISHQSHLLLGGGIPRSHH